MLHPSPFLPLILLPQAFICAFICFCWFCFYDQLDCRMDLAQQVVKWFYQNQSILIPLEGGWVLSCRKCAGVGYRIVTAGRASLYMKKANGGAWKCDTLYIKEEVVRAVQYVMKWYVTGVSPLFV